MKRKESISSDIDIILSELDEPDRKKDRQLIFTHSMKQKEVVIRTLVAAKIDGVQFNSYTNEEYLQTFAIDARLQDGRFIGRTEATSQEVLNRYNREVFKLKPYGEQKKGR